MKTELYYFTGTGNSLNICKALKTNLERTSGETVQLIPLTTLDLSQTVYSEADRVGIIYPTYDLDAPNRVKVFAKQLVVDKNAYVFVYGNSAGAVGNSVHAIQKILSVNGINVANAFSVIYPENSIVYKTTAEEKQKRLKEAEERHEKDAQTILERIINPQNILLKFTTKNHLLGKAIEFITYDVYGFKKINASDACNGCALCTRVCPTQNIKMEASFPVFSKSCESCFACIHSCPRQALRFKRMPKRENYQYRHPNVKLQELILRD